MEDGSVLPVLVESRRGYHESLHAAQHGASACGERRRRGHVERAAGVCGGPRGARHARAQPRRSAPGQSAKKDRALWLPRSAAAEGARAAAPARLWASATFSSSCSGIGCGAKTAAVRELAALAGAARAAAARDEWRALRHAQSSARCSMSSPACATTRISMPRASAQRECRAPPQDRRARWRALFRDLPEAITNTVRLAERLRISPRKSRLRISQLPRAGRRHAGGVSCAA